MLQKLLCLCAASFHVSASWTEHRMSSGLDQILSLVRIHRLRCLHTLSSPLFGHICRLPENTLASQAMQLSIEAHTSTPPAADWKGPSGRPRRNWLQQVEDDINLSVGAAWIADQDRSM